MKSLSQYSKCRIGNIYEILFDLIKQSHVNFTEKYTPEKNNRNNLLNNYNLKKPAICILPFWQIKIPNGTYKAVRVWQKQREYTFFFFNLNSSMI